MAAAMMRAVEIPEGIAPRPFWRHTIAVALTTEMLARADRQYCRTAFTAGFLHNLGRLALAEARPEVLAAAQDRAARDGLSLYDAEHDLLGMTDTDLGGALLASWGFPDEIVEAVEGHAFAGVEIPESHPWIGDRIPQDLATFVAQARSIVAASGVADGLEPPVTPSLCASEGAPRQITRAIDTHAIRLGLGSTMERVDAFLELAGID